jgi:hypothetical protein
MEQEKRCKCGLPSLPYSSYCRGHWNEYNQQKRQQQREALGKQIGKSFYQKLGQREPFKTAPNQKWHKVRDTWRHDNLPIWIASSDDGMYQVRYMTDKHATKRVKGSNGRSWYRLNVAKRLAREVELTMLERRVSA